MSRLQIPLLLGALLCAAPASPASFTPAPWAFQFKNTVDLGPVDQESTDAARARLGEIAKAGATLATLRIDSPGGQILIGSRWIRSVEDLKKAAGLSIDCVVDGTAYSMAAVVLESAVCDRRFATPRSTVLFHNAAVPQLGRSTAAELKAIAALIEALDLSMALAVSARLGMPLERYRTRIAHADWAMAVPEALAAHVIDGIVDPAAIAPPEGK